MDNHVKNTNLAHILISHVGFYDLLILCCQRIEYESKEIDVRQHSRHFLVPAWTLDDRAHPSSLHCKCTALSMAVLHKYANHRTTDFTQWIRKNM